MTKDTPVKTLCIFGDSQVTKYKLLFDENPSAFDGWKLSFFRNPGHNFLRTITENDVLVNPTAQDERFSAFNLETVNPNDFDLFLVEGCQLPTTRYFKEILSYLTLDRGFCSKDFMRDYARALLESIPGYQVAKQARALSKTDLFFHCWALATDGPYTVLDHPEKISLSTRDFLWEILTECFLEDGFILIRQPDDTVVHGCRTHEKYATFNNDGNLDYLHHNAAYAHVILNKLFELHAARSAEN